MRLTLSQDLEFSVSVRLVAQKVLAALPSLLYTGLREQVHGATPRLLLWCQHPGSGLDTYIVVSSDPLSCLPGQHWSLIIG